MLSIIMLHYGDTQVELTLRCLDNLAGTTEGVHEVILWINGKRSQSYNDPLREYHNVQGTEERLSLAAAYNRALHHINGDLVCVLHNDCFPEKGWNKVLEPVALEGNIAFPIVKTNDGLLRIRGMSQVPDWMPPSCCFVVGKDELEVLEGWDERFEFCHFEDMDLFKRATDAGMRLVQCPTTVFHLRGATRVAEVDLANQAFRTNNVRYCRKHGTRDGLKLTAPYPMLELLESKEVSGVDLH